MTLDKFTLKAQEAMVRAQQLAAEHNHQQIEPEHLLKSLLDDPEGVPLAILKKLGANAGLIASRVDDELRNMPRVHGGGVGNVYISQRVNNVTNTAMNEMRQLKDEYVSTEHLFIALAEEKSSNAAEILRSQGVTRDAVYRVLKDIRGSQRVTDQTPEGKYQALQRFGRDLTELARRGKLDPVIGRDDEIRRAIQVLSRRTKNNPVIVGDPGVGKTALIEGIAQRVANGDVPESLKNKRVIQLDIGSLVAGTKYRGESEDTKAVPEEIQEVEGTPFFYRRVAHDRGRRRGRRRGGRGQHAEADAGARRVCRRRHHADEYRKHIERRRPGGRFQPVMVDEPTVDETISILRGLKERYEVHHGVRITDSAIVAAATLSHRYISDRFLPDKAIDLIDESAAKLRTEIDSLPEEIDEIERRGKQLEIELVALKKEKDPASKERAEK
jgi:ATP-dependent Clp protease ATP-binding subunit ClpB